MSSTVSVRSVPGATIKPMLLNVKGCLEDTSPDHIILHHGKNDLKCNDTPEEIADKILNLAALVKTNENEVCISDLVVRNKKLNKNGTEIDEPLTSKCGTSKSSCPKVFYKKDVLRNFAKLTRKHLCQGLFFNKVPGNFLIFFIFLDVACQYHILLIGDFNCQQQTPWSTHELIQLGKLSK